MKSSQRKIKIDNGWGPVLLSIILLFRSVLFTLLGFILLPFIVWYCITCIDHPLFQSSPIQFMQMYSILFYSDRSSFDWFFYLTQGLSQCRLNEGLLTKAIKQQEKLHDVQAARGMLSVLRHESIERVWKVGTSIIFPIMSHSHAHTPRRTSIHLFICWRSCTHMYTTHTNTRTVIPRHVFWHFGLF